VADGRLKALQQRTGLSLLAAISVVLAGPVIAANGGVAGSGPARSDADRDRVAAVIQPTTDFSAPESYELNPGGAATSLKPINRSVFSQPSANMSFERQLDFRVGDGIFRKLWVSSPSSTKSSDGLGPFFNARSCQSCHLKDGRGHPPQGGEEAVSLFLRLSIPPQSDVDRAALASRRVTVIPEPTYGEQLQSFSVQGLLSEGRMAIAYDEESVTLAGGEVVTLRRPSYRVVGLNYGPLHPETMVSPRLTPPMIGMGLLEAVPEADILAAADPDDADGDGISGRPNWAWSDTAGAVALGRFGWKATRPTIGDQIAHAFAGDLGISTPIVAAAYGDCMPAQTACRNAPDGADPVEGVEVTQQMFDLTLFYARNLAVPARRDVDDRQVLAGKRLFYAAGCTGCHRPKLVTARDTVEPEQAFQLIWPYTDLLLHDMGDGLADGRPDGEATGREWRTPPLWGLGLTETVTKFPSYLHDGRARNVLEAILWHGGEAEAAKQNVVAMRGDERDALLAFLGSL
jgi:CxxC motif-containing protein (DUF1111 family)